MRYDAAIIGAGADGLAAATLMARAGLKTVVIERATHAGGRCVTCEFAPGFHASPYGDTVAQIPPSLAARLGLPPAALVPFAPVDAEIIQRVAGALARVLTDAGTPAPKGRLARFRGRLVATDPPPWPGDDWAAQSMASLAAQQLDRRLALTGRAVDPELAGSALTLFAAPQMRARQGGLGTLGAALEAGARAAGAELRFGLEASEIVNEKHRVAGIQLADGSRIAAGAVISTLDFKRTFLSLFRWSDLPADLLRAAGAWRVAGARARLLLALEAPPAFTQPFFVPGDEAAALASFRHGIIPEHPPMLVDPISLRDPTLAPAGSAVVTVTLGAIPARLFDGGWTHEKRELLLHRALDAIRALKPLPPLRAASTIVPPDMEEALGLSGGDLDGGVLAPDQMLGLRPGPRTDMRGLYLAGPSSAAGPLGLTAAGVAAATALLADRR